MFILYLLIWISKLWWSMKDHFWILSLNFLVKSYIIHYFLWNQRVLFEMLMSKHGRPCLSLLPRRAPIPTQLCRPLCRPSAGSHMHLLDRTLSPPPRPVPPLHPVLLPLRDCPPALHLVRLADGRPHAAGPAHSTATRVSLRRHPGWLADAVLHLITI